MNEAYQSISAIAPIVVMSLFALPAFIGVLKQRGFLLGTVILLVLAGFTLAYETLALKTGLPQGTFSYADGLGPKLLETTPWTVIFVYPPILLGAFWFASKFTKGFGRVILAAIFATVISLVLDPAHVKLQLWQWETAGPFYGVPIINYIGWFIKGFIGGWLLHLLWGKHHAVKASIAYSVLAVLLFWTGVNIGIDQWIPVGVGALASLVLLIVLILEKRQLRRESHT
ncbi:MAG: carotenoid biosynthesis protein [Candidatus Saccharibacteria bacterium]|nr:carotenoid biosynthesis protein [Candidatus Saccharibacteria bacterium]